MKFLIDMPLAPALAEWLVRKGYDAVHALSIGLATAADEVILQNARDNGRILVTADLDFPRLLALSHAGGPGLILFRGGQFSELAVTVKLAKVFETIPIAELPVSLVVIEPHRIRRRRLPIA